MKKWLLRILGVVVAFYALGIAWSTLYEPASPVTAHEVIPENEEDVIQRLVRLATEAIAHHAEADGFFKRDAHPVPHGCVRAHFRVRSAGALDPELRHGIYAEPGREYEAWIRFSNALKPDDRATDGRGMAIKVMGISPETQRRRCDGDKGRPKPSSQDFLMVNGAAFFNRDVFEYEEFFTYQSQGAVQQVFYFIKWNPFRWRLRQMFTALEMTTQDVSSLLDLQYFSGLPYKLGPHNTKYSARPCEGQEFMTAEDGPHFLREGMVKHLAERPACFEFTVQRQDLEKYMPIEDSTVLWREEDAAFETVARIEIPPQRFSTDEQNQFCEQLSFAPWQGLPAHQPLGGLNRARKAVYEAVSKRRHARNGVKRCEPQGWCLDLTGGTCTGGEEYFLSGHGDGGGSSS